MNTTSSSANQQRWNSSQPKCHPSDYTNPDQPRHFTTASLHERLRAFGCSGCELGCQAGFLAPVVYRGNPKANKMIIGEAPGLYEDKKGIPFTGPAGQLMDKIWASVGWDVEKDWYVGNVVKCRPVAPQGLGRQNLTPSAKHHKACRPWIEQEIQYLKPHVIALLGATAAKSILKRKDITMAKSAGQLFFSEEFPYTTFYVMYHPAAILHSQRYPEKHLQMRQLMWDHIRKLKQLVDEVE